MVEMSTSFSTCCALEQFHVGNYFSGTNQILKIFSVVFTQVLFQGIWTVADNCIKLQDFLLCSGTSGPLARVMSDWQDFVSIEMVVGGHHWMKVIRFCFSGFY